MSLLELGGKQFTIPVGEVALGSDANCAIPLSGAGVLPRHVVLERQPDGQVVIRKATPEAEVLVNGVRLGVEPTPLLHGDKLEVGGYELTFVDERRAGTTQFVEKVELPEPTAAPQGRAAPERAATRNTGGRVVSLTDGREYVMSGASLVFGREAGCDVVVPETDVSRRHAEIVQTAQGYLLVDSSTNGTFVNEERVRGQRMQGGKDARFDLVLRLVVFAAEENVGRGHAAILLLHDVGDIGAVADRLLLRFQARLLLRELGHRRVARGDDVEELVLLLGLAVGRRVGQQGAGLFLHRETADLARGQLSGIDAEVLHQRVLQRHALLALADEEGRLGLRGALEGVRVDLELHVLTVETNANAARFLFNSGDGCVQQN